MSDDWIEITGAELNVKRAVNFVSAPHAGGIDVFLGTTRSETASDGRQLVALWYEAYDEMATNQMHDLARRARERWPIVKLAIVHRVGTVALADPSVIVAVSCPHRGDAFDACRFLIDTLKAEVAIWKNELWTDGSTSWIDPDSTKTPR